MCVQLNLKPIWSKFDSPADIVHNNTETLISEKKYGLIISYKTARQFPIYDLTEPYTFDRNGNSSGIRLYIPDDKSLTLKLIEMIIEGFFV